MNEDNKNEPRPGKKGFSNLRALGIPTLALLFYLILLDAAVETFISGSPVRWWVVPTVLTYLAVSGALWWLAHPLWRAYGWGTKAVVSFFVLIGLLALTVWRPG